MKKLWLLLSCLLAAGCEDNIVDIDIRDNFVFSGTLKIKELSQEQPLNVKAFTKLPPYSYASISFFDTKGGYEDSLLIRFSLSNGDLDKKCLMDTELQVNGETLKPLETKGEIEELGDSKVLDYTIQYSLHQYMMLYRKSNNVEIKSCGVTHTLNDDEKIGLAEIINAWDKFRAKK